MRSSPRAISVLTSGQTLEPERMRFGCWGRAAYKLMPGHAATYRCSNAIIVGSQATLAQLNPRYRDKTFYVAENAIALERFPEIQRQPHQAPLRLLFVGRLVPYKGADMVLEATRELLDSGKAQLTIVGEGPERRHLEQLAASLGVATAVSFLGNVPHAEVCQHFAEADVFTFPSIREFGGAVVMEAMAMGCVPVVVNYGGPAELVSPQTAFALEIGDRQHIVDQLRSRLDALCVDRSCLAAMSQTGMERARTEFTWEAKARQVLAVYEWVLSGGKKPDFTVA
jgi:glycosyltransferase involved in cell wall biosynthesis